VEILFLTIRLFRILLFDKKFNDFYYFNFENENESNVDENNKKISFIISQLKIDKKNIKIFDKNKKEINNEIEKNVFFDKFEKEKNEVFNEATRKGFDYY
jgi:hypothetical protein